MNVTWRKIITKISRFPKKKNHNLQNKNEIWHKLSVDGIKWVSMEQNGCRWNKLSVGAEHSECRCLTTLL